MKKIKIVFILLISIASLSQNIEIPTNISDNYINPLPTVSSLMNFAEIPVNEFTGTPSINESLFVSKTLSKNINFDVSYSYHPKSINLFEKSSDLGTGWSLNCGGTISRNVLIRPDVNNPNIPSTAYMDTYYFNFMGMTGSFQIEYDSNNINPETVLYKENVENLKIEFIKDANSNKIDSFIVYDKLGNKYVFSSFDVNVAPFIMYTPSGATTIGEKNKQMLEYRSSWHLSEVFDNNNNKVIEFSYDNNVRLEPAGSTNLYYQIKKLRQVNILGYSDIFIDYHYSSYMDEPNSQYHSDPYSISQIIIKDKFNNIMKKFKPIFQYIEFPIFERDNTYPETLYSKPKQRRYLKELKEFNELDELNNKTSFAYNLNFPTDKKLFLDSSGFIDAKDDCYIKNLSYISGLTNDISYDNLQFALSNKETSWLGALKAVSYQIGGGYVLDFETNTFSRLLTNTISDVTFGLLNDDNKQINLIYTLNYNTSNQSFVEFSIPNHQLPGKIYYFRFENDSLNIPVGIAPPDNNINEVEYQLSSISLCQNYCTFPNNFSDHHLSANFYFGENCIGKSLMLSPGTYRINISPYMNLPLTGRVFIYEENYLSQNINRYVYGGGNRIKSIKKYEKLEIQDLEAYIQGNLIETIDFDYMNFDNSNTSSGELSFGMLGNSLYNDVPSSDYQINYKNVRKTFGNNLGYIKSEYYLPSEFYSGAASSNSSLGFNVLKNGLLTRKMVFDNNHKLLEETSIDYTFTQDSNNVNYELTQVNQYLFSPNAVVSSKSISNKKYYYPNNSSTPNILEVNETNTYNPINKMISEHTVSNSNGEELKTKYFYHSGNSIYSQNRIAEIERIETFRNNNLLSKSEIVYNNNWLNNVSYLPQTIKTTKATSITEDRVKYNQYNEYGNPLEMQQEGGMLISYIWGYNKSLPVAKLENIAYSAIPAQHIQAIEAASNANNETSLLAALTALRNDPALANAMISTYTHKPLVGISTATDPKGDVQYYTYDAFNRLQFVKDKDGNIVSENEYHYRTQN